MTVTMLLLLVYWYCIRDSYSCWIHAAWTEDMFNVIYSCSLSILNQHVWHENTRYPDVIEKGSHAKKVAWRMIEPPTTSTEEEKNHFKLKSLEFDESLWSMGVSLCVCVLRLLCVACVPMPKISIFMNYFMPSHWKFIHSNDPQEAYTAHKCAITTKWKWRRRSRRTKG